MGEFLLILLYGFVLLFQLAFTARHWSLYGEIAGDPEGGLFSKTIGLIILIFFGWGGIFLIGGGIVSFFFGIPAV